MLPKKNWQLSKEFNVFYIQEALSILAVQRDEILEMVTKLQDEFDASVDDILLYRPDFRPHYVIATRNLDFSVEISWVEALEWSDNTADAKIISYCPLTPNANYAFNINDFDRADKAEKKIIGALEPVLCDLRRMMKYLSDARSSILAAQMIEQSHLNTMYAVDGNNGPKPKVPIIYN